MIGPGWECPGPGESVMSRGSHCEGHTPSRLQRSACNVCATHGPAVTAAVILDAKASRAPPHSPTEHPPVGPQT